MKPLSAMLSFTLLVGSFAVPQLGHAGAQQNKMKTCNAEADAKGFSGEGKGGDRKAFMKECLSAKPAKTAAAGSQQDKMKACNKEAKEKSLGGDERKKFMKSCLSS